MQQNLREFVDKMSSEAITKTRWHVRNSALVKHYLMPKTFDPSTLPQPAGHFQFNLEADFENGTKLISFLSK